MWEYFSLLNKSNMITGIDTLPKHIKSGWKFSVFFNENSHDVPCYVACIYIILSRATSQMKEK